MQHGLNVDPLNSAACPDPVTLRSLGFAWARLVVRPGCESYVRACVADGLQVLGVLTPESLPFRAGAEAYRSWPVSAWEIGNEMDGDGPASATQDPGTWRNFYYAAMHGLGWPSVPILAGGFVSGQPDLAAAYLTVTGLTAFAAHPYAKDAEAARELLREYRLRFPGLDLWVTEWNRPSEQIVPFARMLADEQVPVTCWFCWSDLQTWGTEGIRLGLVDAQGQPKAEYLELLPLLLEDEHMAPEFRFGFKALADELGPAIVGEPVEDEAYFPTGSHSLQVTSKGLMVYSKEGNKAGFLSFRQP